MSMTSFGYSPKSTGPFARRELAEKRQSEAIVRGINAVKADLISVSQELLAAKKSLGEVQGCADIVRQQLDRESKELARVRDEIGQLIDLRDLLVAPDIPKFINETFRASCLTFTCGIADICGEGRNKAFVSARRYVVERLRDELGLSFPKIGAILSRDHTTIMYLYETRAEWRKWLVGSGRKQPA